MPVKYGSKDLEFPVCYPLAHKLLDSQGYLSIPGSWCWNNWKVFCKQRKWSFTKYTISDLTHQSWYRCARTISNSFSFLHWQKITQHTSCCWHLRSWRSVYTVWEKMIETDLYSCHYKNKENILARGLAWPSKFGLQILFPGHDLFAWLNRDSERQKWADINNMYYLPRRECPVMN